MKRAAWLLAAVLLCAARAEAVIVVYSDKTDFLADSGAESIGAFPDLGLVSTPYSQGGLSFSLGPGATQMFVGQGPSLPPWTTRVSPEQIALSGFEDLNVVNTTVQNMYSLGFDFVEPETDPNVNSTLFVDSIFSVSLFNDSVFVDSFNFSRPNDSAQFVGMWTDFVFDEVRIFESTGGNENEFFGEFYWCETPFAPPVIPEPSSLLLMGLGALGTGVARRRKSS